MRWVLPVIIVVGGPSFAQDAPPSTIEKIFFGEPVERADSYLDPETDNGVSAAGRALQALVESGDCPDPSLGLTGPNENVLAARCRDGTLYWITPDGEVMAVSHVSAEARD